MRGRLFFWALTAALAGFLFGFDTVVISGAEQTIQELWSLSQLTHGMAISMALWGTVAGALTGAFPTDRFGRKKTLLWIGILIAFVSNALIGGMGENAWRWMLGIEAVPALIYSVMCFGLPESPRWLIGRKSDRAGGTAVLRQIHPEFSSAEIESKANEIVEAASATTKSPGTLGKRLRLPVMLAFQLAWVKLMVPETKGRPLEQLEHGLCRNEPRAEPRRCFGQI